WCGQPSTGYPTGFGTESIWGPRLPSRWRKTSKRIGPSPATWRISSGVGVDIGGRASVRFRDAGHCEDYTRYPVLWRSMRYRNSVGHPTSKVKYRLQAKY